MKEIINGKENIKYKETVKGKGIPQYLIKNNERRIREG
jgi:hypothetical protein